MNKEKFLKVRRILSSKYPVFRTQRTENKEKFLPLAVGIREQLFAVEDEVSRTDIRKFLRKWVNKVGYQLALLYGSTRYDLQGNAVGVIEQDHKDAAQKALDGRKKIRGNGKGRPRGNGGQRDPKKAAGGDQIRYRKQDRVKPAGAGGPRRPGGERTLRLRG